MKKSIAVLFVALVATMNLGAQEPAGNATAADWLAYLMPPTGFRPKDASMPLSSNLNDFITATLQKEAITGVEQEVLYAVGQILIEHDHASTLGNSIITKIAGSGLPRAELLAGWLRIYQSVNPEEILQLAYGKPDFGYPLYAKALELSNQKLQDAYSATIVGKGAKWGEYVSWFKSHIANLSSAEQIAALETEIKALLSQPQSPDRDALLVEYRAQRLVLKELGQ